MRSNVDASRADIAADSDAGDSNSQVAIDENVWDTATESNDSPLPDPQCFPDPDQLQSESVGMTVDDFLQLAQSNHPGLAAARARVCAEQGTWEQVGLHPNPVIGYSAQEVGNEDAWGQHGVFVQKTFVRGGKLALNQSVASHDIDRARQEYTAMEQRIVNDVKVAFYQALIAQHRRDVTNKLTDLSSESVRTAELLFKAEELTRINLLQSTTEKQTAQLAAVVATSRELGAKRELAATTGYPDLTLGVLVGDALQALPEHEWQAARERLINCPQLAIQVTRIEKARCALARARAEQVPNLNIQAGVLFDDSTNHTAANFSVSRPLLIHNWNQGNIRRAQAGLATSEHELEQLVLRLEKDLAVVFRTYQAAHQQIDSYVSEILPSSRETMDLVSQGFRAGEVDYLTLLTTQRTYVQTYLQFLDSLQAAWAASVRIEGLLLSGSLPPAQ